MGINPNINKILKGIKNEPVTPQKIADNIIKGDRNALSRAITKLESSKTDEQEFADEVIKLCLPYSGKSRRIGITGVPGVGKSTFIDYFGENLIDNGHKIAILAIDPSSSISGGSILGDKTRMESLSGRIEAFIRPSPTSGTLGGVAAKTRESIILCEAAGFDTIIIETVGVGQSEIAVSSMVDVFMMLLVAGTGDELQGIKRGIMEMVDILVFTKDDGDNINRTKLNKKQFEIALKMFPAKDSLWIPEVLSVSGFEKKGIDDVLISLNNFFEHIKSNDYLAQNRQNQSIQWLNDQILSILKNRFYKNENISNLLKITEQEVVNQQISPIAAAKKLVEKYFCNEQ
ncbi:MAG: methylmalonyl Co-A mutase-associated GTPase MeaB [Bacteroidales bacterium]|nr:methylmalonyl Co-A mutase-associated GTPase MeaB [Bacteroidales bacterium]